jgi:hypothetical protein
MRTKLFSVFTTVIFIAFTFSVSAQKKEERTVEPFSSVGMSIYGDVYISQGSPQKLVLEGNEDILEKLVTEVRDGMLRIKFSTPYVRTRTPVKIWITVPEINGLYLSGSGSINAETAIRSDEMELKVSGSGKINIDDLTCDEVDAAISGSGDIRLGGSADELELAISGSGSCLADQFRAEEVSIRISGSGSCKIDAVKELEAAISGSGSVYYVGNPTIDASVSGSGKIRKMD